MIYVSVVKYKVTRDSGVNHFTIVSCTLSSLISGHFSQNDLVIDCSNVGMRRDSLRFDITSLTFRLSKVNFPSVNHCGIAEFKKMRVL